MTSQSGHSAASGRGANLVANIPWLRLAHAAWLLLAAAGTALFAIGPVTQWMPLQTVCRPVSSCQQFQVDVATARILSEHGISLGAYAVYTAAVMAAVWLLWYGLAALIIWRKPRDRGALLAAFFLILFPQLPVGLLIPWSPAPIAAFLALIFFGLLFPDGRFAPRWTRWLAVFTVLVFVAGAVPFGSGGGLWIFPVLILPAVVVGLQIYRFRVISSWAERQRTKWALLGLVAGIVSLIIFISSGFAVSETQNGSLYGAITTTLFAIAPSAIPVAIGIAVLRSRLWDIDRVISRALAYVTLTVTLGGIYVAGVIGFQHLFGLFLGNGSSAAIALSTLAIVALFGPLRRRIQTGIDRRFYRSRYDAARTLATLGERLRDEVDLAQLAHDLTSVVHDTLHPSHVSLWFRESSHTTPVNGL